MGKRAGLYYNPVKYSRDHTELSVFATNKPVKGWTQYQGSARILSSYLYASLIFVIGLSFTAIN